MEGENFSAIQQELRQLSAEVALLKAQSTRGIRPVSPWLPLKEAATRLHYKSARSLSVRIRNGQFPPDCYRIDATASGAKPKYLINVERYIKLLR